MITVKHLSSTSYIEAFFECNNTKVEIGLLDRQEAMELARELIEAVHELYDFVNHPISKTIGKAIDEIDFPPEKLL